MRTQDHNQTASLSLSPLVDTYRSCRIHPNRTVSIDPLVSDIVGH